MKNIALHHPLGSRANVIHRLVANILTRRARWQQINIDTKYAIKQTILECSELLLLGYQPNVILSSFYTAVAHDKYYALCLNLVRELMRHARLFDLQWRMPQHVLDLMSSTYDVDPDSFPFPTYDV